MTYLIPMTQVGVAKLGCRDELDAQGLDAFSVMGSCVKLYGLFGVRPNATRMLGSWRAGIGFNSFVLMKLSAACGIPLPNSIELFREVDSGGDVHQFVRFGLGF